MKYMMGCFVAILLCFAVLFYAIFVIGGYVFDRVHSYGGPTPMALDTALLFVGLSVASIITVSVFGCRKVAR